MKNKIKNGRIGFTLIELLVVIAIIGILSAVAIVNLNVSRDKAKFSNVQGSLSSLTPAILLCFENKKNLLYNGVNEFGTPLAGTVICQGSETTWPSMPKGWLWAIESSNYSLGIWRIMACRDAVAPFNVCDIPGDTPGIDTYWECNEQKCYFWM
ncbi:MAG: hypothetical protein C3F02_03380 [Parcubacteria group bacterium]|nr:MAG: hypothetical protein C3F02_03380 [Parcubacteria group bacterium]